MKSFSTPARGSQYKHIRQHRMCWFTVRSRRMMWVHHQSFQQFLQCSLDWPLRILEGMSFPRRGEEMWIEKKSEAGQFTDKQSSLFEMREFGDLCLDRSLHHFDPPNASMSHTHMHNTQPFPLLCLLIPALHNTVFASTLLSVSACNPFVSCVPLWHTTH